MPSEGSVSRWLTGVQEGDSAAVQKLWGRYFPRLVSLARLKIRGSPRRAADEEDVALSAFDSFCRNAEQGRFPDLVDRDNVNGSSRAIAGIFNNSRTVLGLMPHPENATDPLLGGTDGQALFSGLVSALQ